MGRLSPELKQEVIPSVAAIPIIGVAEDGRHAVLYEPRLRVVDLGEVSMEYLLATARAATSQAPRE
jgi:hypothetical protein